VHVSVAPEVEQDVAEKDPPGLFEVNATVPVGAPAVDDLGTFLTVAVQVVVRPALTLEGAHETEVCVGVWTTVVLVVLVSVIVVVSVSVVVVVRVVVLTEVVVLVVVRVVVLVLVTVVCSSGLKVR
jgi:hypothetical protein